ncbi:MAG TPA: PEGA domain-containing protein [Bdellovibrionota bacterium]|nr:PEGA domain-containing protein [Bdellovibrionota bacterium]
MYRLFFIAFSLFFLPLEINASPPPWTQEAFWEDGEFYYYVGVSTDSSTEEEGRIEAHERALAEAIQHLFGIQTSMNRRAFISNDQVQWDEDLSVELPKSFLSGVKVVHQYIERIEAANSVKYRVWRAIAVPKNIKNQYEFSTTPTQRYESPIGNDSQGRGQLIVRTIPENAQLFLNGDPIGKSNAFFSQAGAGKYELFVQKEGYAHASRSILISPGNSKEVILSLLPLQGNLLLSTIPAGAKVFLGREFIGITPLTRSLKAHPLRLRIEAEGYQAYEGEFSAPAGQSIKKEIQLSPLPGSLSIQSIPVGASVYSAGGEFLGKTPLFLESYPEGPHQLILESPGFSLVTRNAEVESKKVAYLSHNFGVDKNESPVNRSSARSSESMIVIARADLPLDRAPDSMDTQDIPNDLRRIIKRLAVEELEVQVAASPFRMMTIDGSMEMFWRYVKTHPTFRNPTYRTKKGKFYLSQVAEIDLSKLKE